MAFPTDALDVTVELNIGGTWTDITSLTYSDRDPITVSRGRSAEGADVDRSTCRLTVNNVNGNLSPRNPTGIYYGSIGRNTPLRVRKDPATPGYLLMHDDGRASTPDSANLSITGDIDVRVDMQPTSWTAAQGLANKAVNPSQRSWALVLNSGGTLTFWWSADGSALLSATSTAAVAPPASGRLCVRATLDVNVGGTNKEVKFYTAADINSSFTQLGSTVNTAGTTSIFDSTAAMEIGGSQGIGAADDLTGRLYAAKVFASLDGTSIRTDVNLDDEEPGPGPFVDGQSLTWTLLADASIVRPDIRFSGEVSDWPQRWDHAEVDVYVPLEASGILRRLTQGASPLHSTLYRGYTRLASPPKAYWPVEDGPDATEIASALDGHPPMFVTTVGSAAGPDFASNSDFKCSAPLPTFGGSQWVGPVPDYTSTGDIQVWFLMAVPAAGSVDAQGVCTIRTIGTAPEWRLLYESNGDLTIQAYAADGTQLFTNTAVFNVNGRLLRVDIELHQNGANVEWDVAVLEVGASSGGVNSGTLNSRTISKATSVTMNAGGDHTDIVCGHISVHDTIRSLFDLAQELNAYSGEKAARRVARLCSEEAITTRLVGDADATAAMGPQLPGELVNLLRECEAADGGILFEPRDLFGLAYRSRDSLCNQTAALALDYDAQQLIAMEPIDDDRHVRNDVTAQRVGGSSSRAVKASGTLSVQAPPAGVGRYDERVDLSLAADSQLPDQAGWRLWLGTQDEARYPVVGVDLNRRAYVTNQPQARLVEDLDVGDRLTITGQPSFLPPDLISQLAQGFTEVLATVSHAIDINCATATPFDLVGVYDNARPDPYGVSRYTSDGTTTTEALDTTETGVDVTTPSGPVWSIADGSFDIIIGGERMTVTAISGAGAAQTFTVTRSVNGVVKSHLTGATVELFAPAVYAI